jgi:hypothetical protein
MQNIARKASLYFAAGAFGGLANGLAVWLAGHFGITAALGVAISPSLSPPMLYHRVVWGGIWGLVFLVPLAVRAPALRALLYSLGPTFVQLFIIFPEKAGKGMMGLDLGTLTPAFVVIFNFIWAMAAILLLKAAKED